MTCPAPVPSPQSKYGNNADMLMGELGGLSLKDRAPARPDPFAGPQGYSTTPPAQHSAPWSQPPAASAPPPAAHASQGFGFEDDAFASFATVPAVSQPPPAPAYQAPPAYPAVSAAPVTALLLLCATCSGHPRMLLGVGLIIAMLATMARRGRAHRHAYQESRWCSQAGGSQKVNELLYGGSGVNPVSAAPHHDDPFAMPMPQVRTRWCGLCHVHLRTQLLCRPSYALCALTSPASSRSHLLATSKQPKPAAHSSPPPSPRSIGHMAWPPTAHPAPTLAGLGGTPPRRPHVSPPLWAGPVRSHGARVCLWVRG